jgi:hypothetical protein
MWNALMSPRPDVRTGCWLCWLTSTLFHGTRVFGVPAQRVLLVFDVATVNAVAVWFLSRLWLAEEHNWCVNAWAAGSVMTFAAAFWCPQLHPLVHLCANAGIHAYGSVALATTSSVVSPLWLEHLLPS